jgi:hypothetical protein
MAHAVQAMLEQPNVDKDPVAAFYRAVDLLTNPSLLEEGVKLAMSAQRDILQQVKTVLERRMWRGAKSRATCRVVVLQKTPPVFHHPDAIRRLAVFLLGAIANRFDRDEEWMPIAVCVHVEARRTYMCVGVTDTSQYVSGNPFGAYFERAYERSSANMGHDFFDTSIAEVASEDFPKWYDALLVGFAKASMSQPNYESQNTSNDTSNDTSTETQPTSGPDTQTTGTGVDIQLRSQMQESSAPVSVA